MSEEELDVKQILSCAPFEFTTTYNQRDLLVFALSIGEDSLRFSYELDDNFAVFPLFPSVLPFKAESQDVVPFPPPTIMQLFDQIPTLNPAMVVHGEHSLELLEPLNPLGDTLQCTTRVISLLDKAKGALLETQTDMFNSQGRLVARLVAGSFVRGLTGFKGASTRKNASRAIKIPVDSPPDLVEIVKTSPQQAQWFRLSGDYNPLHVDPDMARAVGYPKPILHGLCTMSIASRFLWRHFCLNQVENFHQIRGRFAQPCFPGETLEIRMWRVPSEPLLVLFQVLARERQVVVLDGGEFRFRQPGAAGLEPLVAPLASKL